MLEEFRKITRLQLFSFVDQIRTKIVFKQKKKQSHGVVYFKMEVNCCCLVVAYYSTHNTNNTCVTFVASKIEAEISYTK